MEFLVDPISYHKSQKNILLRPTEEEMNEAQSKKRLLRVPKGTSDYQASWIFDAEEVDQDDEDDDDDDDEDDAEVWRSYP